jgi:LPS export ABC transporter protein LptC
MISFIYNPFARKVIRILLWSFLFIFIFFGLISSYFYKILTPTSEKLLHNNTIISPRFYSLDHEDRPYSINAKRAYRYNHDSFSFISPTAHIKEKDGSQYYLTSNKGFYKKTQKLLYLTGNVYLFNDNNYSLNTQEALMNMKTKDIQGNKFVYGNSTLGDFKAEGFKILQDGKHLLLKGKSHLTLTQDSIKKTKNK